MPNLKNYGTLENPIWMTDPPQTADGTTTTPYNRYDQAHVSEANMIKDLQDTLSDGTIGNTTFFGTGVTGTEGDISYTVSGSKANDLYLNTSSFNLYKAKAANVWNYLGTLRGPAGIGITAIEINSSGHLMVTLGNGSPTDLGKVVGDPGEPGTNGAGSGWDTLTDTASTSCSYALTHGKYKYFSNSAITALTITSSLANIGDICRVEFTSPSTATTYTKPTGCRHFGDDCDSSADFTPAANTPYSLTYELCGNGLKCYVKSL